MRDNRRCASLMSQVQIGHILLVLVQWAICVVQFCNLEN